ncbi:hypothetical protein ACFV0T_36120 [Streptomyces sp. NPDC059582]|uniref:hypothetical protein n=1 Tax=Streptomyces sp. NPDC059582 TaxID=3346875 RepID=UPI00367DFBD7
MFGLASKSKARRDFSRGKPAALILVPTGGGPGRRTRSSAVRRGSRGRSSGP